jgi:hypothetical protein
LTKYDKEVYENLCDLCINEHPDTEHFRLKDRMLYEQKFLPAEKQVSIFRLSQKVNKALQNLINFGLVKRNEKGSYSVLDPNQIIRSRLDKQK